MAPCALKLEEIWVEATLHNLSLIITHKLVLLDSPSLRLVQLYTMWSPQGCRMCHWLQLTRTFYWFFIRKSVTDCSITHIVETFTCFSRIVVCSVDKISGPHCFSHPFISSNTYFNFRMRVNWVFPIYIFLLNSLNSLNSSKLNCVKHSLNLILS